MDAHGGVDRALVAPEDGVRASATLEGSIMPGKTRRDNGHKALCPLSACCATQSGADETPARAANIPLAPALLRLRMMTIRGGLGVCRFYFLLV